MRTGTRHGLTLFVGFILAAGLFWWWGECERRGQVVEEVRCAGNLRIIEMAKVSMAYEKGLADGEPITARLLSGYVSGGERSDFLRCPIGGVYHLGCVGVRAVCSLHGDGELPDASKVAAGGMDSSATEPLLVVMGHSGVGISRDGRIVAHSLDSTRPVVDARTESNWALGTVVPLELLNLVRLVGQVDALGLAESLPINQIWEAKAGRWGIMLRTGVTFWINSSEMTSEWSDQEIRILASRMLKVIEWRVGDGEPLEEFVIYLDES